EETGPLDRRARKAKGGNPVRRVPDQDGRVNSGVGSERSPLFRWRDAVTAQGNSLSAMGRYVALLLSLYMDGDGGSCFPSVTTLAARGNSGERTVRRAIRELERAGWL